MLRMSTCLLKKLDDDDDDNVVVRNAVQFVLQLLKNLSFSLSDADSVAA